MGAVSILTVLAVPRMTDSRHPCASAARSCTKKRPEGADGAAAYWASSCASYVRHAARVEGDGPAAAAAGVSDSISKATIGTDRNTMTSLVLKFTNEHTAIAIMLETMASTCRRPVQTAVSPRLPASETTPFRTWKRASRSASSRREDGGRSLHVQWWCHAK